MINTDTALNKPLETNESDSSIVSFISEKCLNTIRLFQDEFWHLTHTNLGKKAFGNIEPGDIIEFESGIKVKVKSINKSTKTLVLSAAINEGMEEFDRNCGFSPIWITNYYEIEHSLHIKEVRHKK